MLSLQVVQDRQGCQNAHKVLIGGVLDDHADHCNRGERPALGGTGIGPEEEGYRNVAQRKGIVGEDLPVG